MRKKWVKQITIVLVFVLLVLNVNYSNPLAMQEDGTKTVDARELLQIALDTNQHSEIAQKFWFNGWVRNYVQKRKTTSMFSGSFVLPHGYYVDARMAGVPFRYYKWDEYNYIWTERDDWSRVDEEHFALDPFAGFEWWLPFLEQAEQLPNEEVLSRNTQVFKIKIDGKEWVQHSGSPIFDELLVTMQNTPGIEHLLDESYVEMTIWIGDDIYSYDDLVQLANKKGVDVQDSSRFEQWIKDNRFIWDEELGKYHHHLLYQYYTLIHFPIPGAGMADQETYFRIYNYDDPGISLKTPEEMEQYVIQKEVLKNNQNNE